MLRDTEICLTCYKQADLNAAQTEEKNGSFFPDKSECSETPKGRNLCQHCSKRGVNRPRGLCTPCYIDLDIRRLYPPKIVHKPLNEHQTILPVLTAYPDPSSMPRCLHGQLDGECTICEREQRSTLVMETSWEEEKEEETGEGELEIRIIRHNAKKKKWR